MKFSCYSVVIVPQLDKERIDFSIESFSSEHGARLNLALTRDDLCNLKSYLINNVIPDLKDMDKATWVFKSHHHYPSLTLSDNTVFKVYSRTISPRPALAIESTSKGIRTSYNISLDFVLRLQKQLTHSIDAFDAGNHIDIGIVQCDTLTKIGGSFSPAIDQSACVTFNQHPV